MFNRLTTRLILSHLLVIAVAMALLSFVLLSLVQGYFLQATQQSLTIQARLTAQALTSSQGITLTNIMQTISAVCLERAPTTAVQPAFGAVLGSRAFPRCTTRRSSSNAEPGNTHPRDGRARSRAGR